MALTLAVGMTASCLAAAPHAANGANIVKNGKWASFSVCTREDGGEWEDSLKAIRTTDYPNGQQKGVDYATEGRIKTSTGSDNFDFLVSNSGWDGEYDKTSGALLGDNPWGMTATLDMGKNIVEKGREYTLSFKIKSTLKVGEGEDEVLTKQINVKAYHPGNGDPAFGFYDVNGIDDNGFMVLNYQDTKADSDENWVTVSAKFQVPNKNTYIDGKFGVKFALGAYIVSREKEIGMRGHIYVKDFKVTAGEQKTVTFKGGTMTKTQYVNVGATAEYVKDSKPKYTLLGYKAPNGTIYTENNISSYKITKDTVFTAVWQKTPKPSKPSFKLKSGKKKATIVFKNTKNAKGYQIKSSKKKNMKGSKTTSFNAATGQKKVSGKRGKYLYVKVRAYNIDSEGNKIYGSYSKVKKVFVR